MLNLFFSLRRSDHFTRFQLHLEGNIMEQIFIVLKLIFNLIALFNMIIHVNLK